MKKKKTEFVLVMPILRNANIIYSFTLLRVSLEKRCLFLCLCVCFFFFEDHYFFFSRHIVVHSSDWNRVKYFIINETRKKQSNLNLSPCSLFVHTQCSAVFDVNLFTKRVSCCPIERNNEVFLYERQMTWLMILFGKHTHTQGRIYHFATLSLIHI